MPTAETSASASPASVFASALLLSLSEMGLTDVVVCPGSRSQALGLAACELEQQGTLTVHVRIDERSAAFFALGLALETGRAAAVVTTSGTAVANLTPAVLEAHHSGTPLILLTADRPSELRGIRSNQTTMQAGMFGEFVRLDCDVEAPVEPQDAVPEAVRIATTAWRAAHTEYGPVQLNLAFREPLSGAVSWDSLHAEVAGARAELATEDSQPSGEASFELTDFIPTVVVAGAGAGPAAEAFAHEARLPLLAEVVSGARFGREAITHYRELLRDEHCGGQVRRVIVFGVPTLSREIPQLIQRDGVETIVVAETESAEYYNPGHRVRTRVSGITLGAAFDTSAAHAWLGEWVLRDRELIAATTTVHSPDLDAARETGYKERSAYAKSELAAMRAPVTRAMLAEAVWRATWPHDRLVLGASKLIRVLDSLAQPRNIRVLSNRGLAGIDGTISTANGVASASQAEGELGATRVLLGDLTALHDVGGLFWGAGEEQPRIQLFIGNDGGGSIFDALEVAGTADPAAFDRVMFTPHQVSFEHLASAYGWSYTAVSTRSELEAVLTAPVEGRSIVEVKLERYED